MKDKIYDCIIVGGGIGGLITANILANNKKSVLLLEKNDFTGGFYSQTKVGKYDVDTSVSYFLGFEKGGGLDKFIHDLNLENILTFKKVLNPDHYIFPDFEFTFISDYEELKSSLENLFPNEIDNIETFFSIVKNVYNGFLKTQRTGLDKSLIKYFELSYFDFLDEIFLDEKLKAILSARAFDSNVNMVTMVSYLGKMIFEGLFQETNNINLPKILEKKYMENGGNILYNQKIEQAIISNETIEFVQTRDKVFKAKDFISACDMTKFFCSILKPNIDKDVHEAIKNKKTSLSSVSLYIVTQCLPKKLRENKVARTYLFNSYNVRQIYINKENGVMNCENSYKINTPSILDLDFDQKESYQIRVEIDMNICFENSTIDKTAIIEEILPFISQQIGLNKSHIIDYKLFLPSDFENLTGTRNGASSGWRPDTIFDGSSKFERIVAKNFYQVGCWDKFGSGIFSIYLSSKRAANSILRQ